MRKATRSQWIKCTVVTLLYLAFLVWVGSWMGLVVLPFIFDAYISKRIPWNWWRTSPHKWVRTLMSWVDAIVFALVAAYFVFAFFFQNYQIPSSSLEKSLLVGDYLCVSKLSYGPRIPNTPLSMPLAQHTLPVLNTKSYIEWPQWKYRRVPGLGQVQPGDIVVFNFPAGDTVALANQAEDIYAQIYRAGQALFARRAINMDSLSRLQQRMVYDIYYAEGSKILRSHPEVYGRVVYRPVDRRENYVKRCVGMPGDTLQIIDRTIYRNGVAQQNPEGVQFLYEVQVKAGQVLSDEFLYDTLGLSREDTQRYTPGSTEFLLPLTAKALATLLARKDAIVSAVPVSMPVTHDMYPKNLYTNWTVDNYGPIWIPRKGATVSLTLENLPVYERCIVAYEKNTLRVAGDGTIFINGQATDRYTCSMDYYWMMGDNRHNSADSRFWGFVPEDHVVGKPLFVWLSLDKDRGWLSGKIRWGRLFTGVK
ncbi:MAG: S26 family signal peptidase [Prevotellaceae bacterium]|jgi:signal peptidase I|nr:S26 family signal peptidase [Prevotellaceae bacterium]